MYVVYANRRWMDGEKTESGGVCWTAGDPEKFLLPFLPFLLLSNNISELKRGRAAESSGSNSHR